MEYTVKTGAPAKQRVPCLVLGIHEKRVLTPPAQTINEISNGYLDSLLRKAGMTGKVGQSLMLHETPGLAAERLLLIGCGKERTLDEQQYRKIITHSIKQLNAADVTVAASYLPGLNVRSQDCAWCVEQAIRIVAHEQYKFNDFKRDRRSPDAALARMVLLVPARRDLPQGELGRIRGTALARGVKLARDLANRPANACTPTYLAEQAQALGETFSSVKVKVLTEEKMKKLGMNSLLSVSQGSAEPARLITFQYKGEKGSKPPVVIVGKGVTFDTGGISIKPAAAMDEMKFDMCGAAAVFGVVAAVAAMQLPINLVGVVPATENMPGSRATKPGDIFTSMSGQTVEVLNTDAEGRLILCDALTYSERFNPAVVIDVATLTGACVVALGKHATGLFSNHEPLARELLRAGAVAGDRAWQLPLWEDYEKQLDSPFADIANIGSGRDAGAVTAACFLGKFARDYQWAHLDIAGTAWVSGKNKCATGRPVPLLVQYLRNRCAAQG